MSDNGHVMFAECLQDIPDDELMAEYERVRRAPSSNWRAAVLNQVEQRRLAPCSNSPRPERT